MEDYDTGQDDLELPESVLKMFLHNGELGVNLEDTLGCGRLGRPGNVDVVGHGGGGHARKV